MLATEEQLKELTGITFGEIEPENGQNVIELLISYTTPEWDDMDEDERYSYYFGFLRGYKASLELHKYIIDNSKDIKKVHSAANTKDSE